MNKKSIFKLFTVILLAFLVIGILMKFNINIRKLNINTLVHYIRNYGKFAGISFLIICGLKPIMLFMPAAMFSIVGGILFGPFKGFTLNMIGFFLSGTLAFYLSRFLGKSAIDKILKGRALKLNSNLEKNGFKILFLLRLPPVLPYDPLSYTCGLTKMTYRDFILASLLGVIPETLCYSVMGQNILNPCSVKFIIPLIIIIFATAASTYVFKKANSQEYK
ncbi:putative membrane protein YdjX (TVP38/TMEM64 family) [Clostridium tetanomorphum]|uniref:TVP38/TMEM64 family membrane protein n=1 Tax=Clostridium tetanomorphum TaxID=1553 RepID=A0A923EB74_CLOTT|nr:TVP38/TMEM64 family protein [Clostridium tetanomorphum]KAJ53445.1 DedA family protein [Clostridium tetanomorphum DSM 665]MBC2398481.1 TVP38/TMEM64 family protein [Clostridium tetanomorphum]MBP1865326.1 putative membrane protein YdjX (TVP38/TMEM64 family) [Clostridium tetanomorphum]NRS85249.1 putative membrane protein YdjX (TVP38/TMEM64 family) [Clostridium tetanomorphum]NRZ98426.1 putative membrane protein YdjX (TVP38/TMEM64 family) [Clostridium tetanomorphum]